MNANDVEALSGGVGGSPGESWLPETEALVWATVQDRRRRYDNDAGELFAYRTDLHVAGDEGAYLEALRGYMRAGRMVALEARRTAA